jgi:hypothetical protein
MTVHFAHQKNGKFIVNDCSFVLDCGRSNAAGVPITAAARLRQEVSLALKLFLGAVLASDGSQTEKLKFQTLQKTVLGPPGF